jgi:hypothetical protein
MARKHGVGASRKRQASGQESKLLNLIEQADTIKRYHGTLEKIAKGSLEVPGFIKEVSMNAALTVAHIMHTSTDEKVQLAAATDLLDRAGYNKSTKVQVGGTITVDHDASKMELINLILSSARRAGIKTAEEKEALLEARRTGVVRETAATMEPGTFVDVVAEALDEQAKDPLTPESLGPDALDGDDE